MLDAVKRKTVFLALSLIVAIICPAVSAQASDDSRRSMTGVWFTKAPASWVYQDQAGVFTGSTSMRWELEEDANGMIRGFNIWYAADAVEGPSVGAMCMVGARGGSRVVITEAEVDNALLPTFEFTCTHRKGRLARCLGNGFSDQPPVALRGRMNRVKDPTDRDSELAEQYAEDINAVRAACAGTR